MDRFTIIVSMTVAALYNLALFGGVCFLIVEYDWSKWWLVGACLMAATLRVRSDEGGDK